MKKIVVVVCILIAATFFIYAQVKANETEKQSMMAELNLKEAQKQNAIAEQQKALAMKAAAEATKAQAEVLDIMAQLKECQNR